MKILSFTGIPGQTKGWAIVRIGQPDVGDWVEGPNGVEQVSSENLATISPRSVIVIEVKRWEIPRPDIAKFLPIPARFRNSTREPWIEGTLTQYNSVSGYKWKCDENRRWYAKVLVDRHTYLEKKNEAQSETLPN
jgi:hypothetical protein